METERAINEATKDAESTLASAKSQAKQMLDEATVRASAIHDGAERRLNLLTSRHTETMRRLTEIRDVVTNLVASETSRGSLEDEVAKSVASSFAATGGPAASGGRQGGAAEARRGPTGRAGAREPGQERDKGADIKGADMPAASGPSGPGHHGQHPGGGHDTRPGAAVNPARSGPDNGSAEAPGAATGENVRVLPE
jgi:vacuolar-type H+-ATPase subunit H